MSRIEFSVEFRRFLMSTNKVLQVEGDNLIPTTTQELNALLEIHHAINLMNTILVNRNFRFSNDPKKIGSNWPKHRALQTALFHALNVMSRESMDIYFPNSKPHPYINLLFRLKELISLERKSAIDKDSQRENRALQKLRLESKQKRFRIEVDAFRKGPDENTEKLRRFFTQCLKVEEKLNFVRLDLYSEQGRSSPSLSSNTDSRTVKKNFKLLIDYARKLLKKTMVGYAWKLNHSASTSYHYQLLIFCLPVDRKTDNAIANHIGEMWSQLTEGVGIYFWHEGMSLTKFAYEGGSLNWKMEDARARLRQLSKEVFVNDYYIKADAGRSFKSFSISGVIDPRLTLAERKKIKALQEEREKKRKKRFSEMQLPFSLKKPATSKRSKVA